MVKVCVNGEGVCVNGEGKCDSVICSTDNAHEVLNHGVKSCKLSHKYIYFNFTQDLCHGAHACAEGIW